MATDRKTSRSAGEDSGETSLEMALGRLEEIVAEIEKTPPPLEELIGRYEEGMRLLSTCREKLDAAEKRIEIITRDARGNAVLEPFEEE
jgi:exodeoxyribonuclease VII small subunit